MSWWVTPYRFAISACVALPFSFFISILCFAVILVFGLLSPIGTLRGLPDAIRCLWFSRRDIYSKFSKQLFIRLKSLWFTVKSLGPINARSTRRWTKNFFTSLCRSLSPTTKYPFIFSCFKIRSFTRFPFGLLRIGPVHTSVLAKDLTLPLSLTSYPYSYPGIGSHFSIRAFLSILLGTSTPLLSSCSTYQIHPFELGITLPYSEACHFKDVVRKVTREVGPVECEAIKKRSIILTSEAWRVIRTDIQNNCAVDQCVELNGKVDAIFLAIDKGLSQIP